MAYPAGNRDSRGDTLAQELDDSARAEPLRIPPRAGAAPGQARAERAPPLDAARLGVAARARARAARGARLHLLLGLRPRHRQLRGLRVQRPDRVRLVLERCGGRDQLAAVEEASGLPARLSDGGGPR